MQTTNRILLVRPFRFRKNEETVVNNYYQQDLEDSSAKEIAEQAVKEFDDFVAVLQGNGIQTLVLQDNLELDTPDSIFPNNVISFHQDKLVFYPMFAENRRLERNLIKAYLLGENQEHIEWLDYSSFEDQRAFLEGTGCLILDRVHKKAYCSISPRASAELVHQFCLDFDYQPIIFEAFQTVGELRMPIYHTNVMLSIGQSFAVICLDSIDNIQHQNLVLESLREEQKEIIIISEEQVSQFAGNILEVKSSDNSPVIVMSSQAYQSFHPNQLQQLEKYGKIIHSPLETIETCGGGSARCMMAEIF
ncbi:citrulline utilization hydrolase CtlX [Sphingobacterium hungaricum]|uniref:Amidinotransferase n=1 Tax=Sphingobacterium hungaricum TaxID=2082723 RepID=A0A928YR52_9SPHI|nr:arginine deiminase-related protein [Sphingobacterium hungaricum]MBE8712993.1 amidinotransferase [Sphingobacterium hungaricum]